MAQSYRSRFLAAQRASEQGMKRLFTALARDIAAEVTRRAAADGNVPRSATFEIQQAAGQLVQRLFLGRNRTGELAPFDTLLNGALIPLSPYMRQLWESIRAVVRIPVEQNAVILANRLPADVLIVMRNATGNPFVAAKRAVSEQVFRPNPLAAYEAPHTWVDPNGYRLSDRIWNVAATERRRLDIYLDTAIREGRGALQMSRELEQFLIPGQSLPETNAPYGTTASFDAMRLARTEITRAHGRATEASAAMNPFVTGLKWNLSARHPRVDICDEYARGGPNGDGTYTLGETPAYPAHPQCICFLTNVLASVAASASLIDELRADIQSARQEFVNLAGPLQVEAFKRLLLGQGLTVEGQTFTRVVGAPTLPPGLRQAQPPAPELVEGPPVVIEPPPVVVEPPVVADPLRMFNNIPDKHRRKVQRYIDVQVRETAEEYNVSEAEVRRELERITADLTDPRNPVAIRLPSEVIDKIMDSGRIKSQFETRTSEIIVAIKERGTAELRGMGYERKSPPEQRPIYGFVADPRVSRSANMYGDIQFELKPEVRQRTTVTIGDSLEGLHRGWTIPTPINDMGPSAYGEWVATYYGAATGRYRWDNIGLQYVEVQIHGQVKMSDIERVRDTENRLSDAQIRRLNALDIEVLDGGGYVVELE